MKLREHLNTIWRYHRTFLDRSIPYTFQRWTIAVVLMLIYFFRILYVQGRSWVTRVGFYIITYFMMLYLLDRCIGFLAPRDIPDFGEEEEEEGVLELDGITDPSKVEASSFLPTREGDEFKPFFRRVKEMDFWLSVVRSLSLCFVLTFFQGLNFPIYWPLLFFYFIVLVLVLFKQRLQHMYKHNYVPFDMGKKKFYGKRGGRAAETVLQEQTRNGHVASQLV